MRSLEPPPGRERARIAQSDDDEPGVSPDRPDAGPPAAGVPAAVSPAVCTGIALGVLMIGLEMTGRSSSVKSSLRHGLRRAGRSSDLESIAESEHSGRSRRASTCPTRCDTESAASGTLSASSRAAVFAVAVLLHRKAILIATDAGERVQFDLRRAVRASSATVDELFRQDQARADHQPLHERHQLAARDQRLGLDTVVKNSLMMLVAAGMLLATSWQLFLAVAWLGPVLLVCNRVYRAQGGGAAPDRARATRVATNLAEHHGRPRGVGVQPAIVEPGSISTRCNTTTRRTTCRWRVNGVYQPLLQLIGVTGKIIILLLGAYLLLADPSPRGRVSARPIARRGRGGVFVLGLVYAADDQFGNFHNQLLQAMAGAERVFQLLDTRPVCDAADACRCRASTGAFGLKA